MSQKKYETHRDLPTSHINKILAETHRGTVVEAQLEDGYLLKTPSGSMTKISNSEMTRLTQRYMHQQEHTESANTKNAREYLESNPEAKARHEAGVRGYVKGQGQANPFADKDGNQSSHRNPFYGQQSGLPSERADAPQGHQVRTAPERNPNEGLLPSDPRFDHSFKG